MPYKAVLFDANNTLWEWPSDSVDLIYGVLHFLDKPTDRDLIRTCLAAASESWFEPQLLALETNGQGAALEEVQKLLRKRDMELLKLMDIPDQTGLVRSAIQSAFASRRPVLFPDVAPALHELRQRGVSMAVVSNGWQQPYDAARLGIAGYFGSILGSAHVGYRKPMPEIFHRALQHLDVVPQEALHVGDTYDDDVAGAQQAAVYPVLLDRTGAGQRDGVQTISSLSELLSLSPEHYAKAEESGRFTRPW